MPPTYGNGHISATGDLIHFMFGSRVGFSGTADRTALFTVWTNPRWRPPPCWKISSGDISTTGRPIHFIFSSMVGFSGTADLMALFLVRTNPRWWPQISNGHISATSRISPQRLTIYLYSAHRAVIFAIAQLSCMCIWFHLTVILPVR